MNPEKLGEINGLTEMDRSILSAIASEQAGQRNYPPSVWAKRFYNPRDPIEVSKGNFNSALGRLRRRLADTDSEWTIVNKRDPKTPKLEGLIVIEKITDDKPTIWLEPKSDLPAALSEDRSLALQVESVLSAAQVQILMDLGFNVAEYRKQALQVAEHTIKVQKGEIQPVEAMSLVGQLPSEKTRLAQERIRQIIIPLIKPQTTWTDRHLLAQQMNEILQYLGRNAVETFRAAVLGKGGLPALTDIEQMILYSNLSVNMLTKLEYIDLDSCSESQFASYISRSALKIMATAEKDDDLDILISALSERDQEASIDTYLVLERLISHDRFEKILERILESARFRGFRNELIRIFSAHRKTSYLCRQIQEELDLEAVNDNEPILPSRNIDRWP